jgi:hypothetical protein
VALNLKRYRRKCRSSSPAKSGAELDAELEELVKRDDEDAG